MRERCGCWLWSSTGQTLSRQPDALYKPRRYAELSRVSLVVSAPAIPRESLQMSPELIVILFLVIVIAIPVIGYFVLKDFFKKR